MRSSLEEHPRLEVHRSPGYSRELDPDERVWSHLKEHEGASYAPRDVKELRSGIRSRVLRMSDRARPIRSFVQGAHLSEGVTERGLGPNPGHIVGGVR